MSEEQEGGEPLDCPGYVYFIRCVKTKFMRIGWSLDNPESRFLMTEVYSPTPLERVAVIKGTKGDEFDIHVLFAKNRDHAEWFRPSKKIDRFIAKHGTEWSAGKIGIGRARRHQAPLSDEESQYWMNGCYAEMFPFTPPPKPRKKKQRKFPEPESSEPKKRGRPRNPSTGNLGNGKRFGPLQALLDQLAADKDPAP
jgi:hypothetical protein